MEILVDESSKASASDGTKGVESVAYLYSCVARMLRTCSREGARFVAVRGMDAHKSDADALTAPSPRARSLAPGLALSSHATSLAALFGIPPPVLTRAEEVTHAVSTFSIDSLAVRDEAQMSALDREELRRAEWVARRLVGLELDEPEEGEEGEGLEELRKKLRWVLDGEGGDDEGGMD